MFVDNVYRYNEFRLYLTLFQRPMVFFITGVNVPLIGPAMGNGRGLKGTRGGIPIIIPRPPTGGPTADVGAAGQHTPPPKPSATHLG